MPKKKTQNTRQTLRVKANDEDSKGAYSNIAIINHTNNEFILDFIIQIGDHAQLVSRVITSPQHMIQLHGAVEKNIEKYESQFGKINRKETKTKKPEIKLH